MCNKNERKIKHKSRFKAFSIGTILGMLAGVIIGLFKAPKKGEELQEDFKNLSVDLLEKWSEIKEESQKIIDKVFGKITKESIAIYMQTREEILELAKKKKDLKKQDFEKIVEKVIKKYKKEKKEFRSKLNALEKEFKKEWKYFQNKIKK